MLLIYDVTFLLLFFKFTNIFKEASLTSASSPDFFSKKIEIFKPLEVYTYLLTACLILLATST